MSIQEFNAPFGETISGTTFVGSANLETIGYIISVDFNLHSPATSVLNGTTAGTVTYFMVFVAPYLKKFIAYFNGYENDTTTNQSVTFPVPFTTVNGIVLNTTGLTITVDLTTLTITAPDATTTYNGIVIVEGY